MKLDTDNVLLQMPCPSCEQKVTEMIGRLKDDPNITCPMCGAACTFDSIVLAKNVAAAEKALTDFRRTLKYSFQ